MNAGEKKEYILKHENMTKVILLLALPIMLNNIIQTCYNLADSFWIGKIGTSEQAAIGFVWPVIFFTISIGIGLSIGGTTLIAQYVGAGEEEKATVIAEQLFLGTITFAIVFSILGNLATPTILRLMGADGELFIMGSAYLRVLFFDLPFGFTLNIFTAIRQGQGDTVTPTRISAMGVIVNIVLDPIFIFVFGLGIQGAALATVLSKVPFVIYVVKRIFNEKDGLCLRVNHMKPNFPVLKQIVKVAIPVSIGQSLMSLGFVFLQTFVRVYGVSTLAAFSIGNRINSLIFMPVTGIGAAVASIAGQNLGANNVSRAKLAFVKSCKIGATCSIVGAICLISASEHIVAVFSSDPLVVEQGAFYLKFIAASTLPMSIVSNVRGLMQGAGQTVYSMIMDMGRLWFFRLPLVVIFQNYTSLNEVSIWAAVLSSNYLAFVLAMVVYMTGKWKTKIIH